MVPQQGTHQSQPGEEGDVWPYQALEASVC